MMSDVAATLGPSGGVAWILEVLRCRARLPNVLSSFPEFLVTARMLGSRLSP